MKMRGRQVAASLGLVVLLAFMFALTLAVARSARLAGGLRQQEVDAYVTARMIADDPRKFLGHRVRLTCKIETFIDGPVEGPAAYASCPPARDDDNYIAMNVEFVILRGDEFGDLDVNDTLTLTGTVNHGPSDMPGTPRAVSTIDVDSIEQLSKAVDGEATR